MDDGIYYIGIGSGYFKIPARLMRLEKFPQNPIHPDEMEFTTPSDTFSPDLIEVVLVVDGSHVFHGVISKVTDSGLNKTIVCKSMQWLLQWRYMPDLTYNTAVNMNTVFSSSTPSVVPGFLWMINSWVPNGLWTAYSSTVHKLAGAGLKSALGDKALYAFTSYPNAAATDTYDGIKVLGSSSAIPTAANKYYRTNDDLYIRVGDGSYLPNAFYVAAANWCDTKIRLGTVDKGLYKSAIKFSLVGRADKSLNDFAEQAGMEVQFLPRNNGYVYMHLLNSVHRGSASAPIWTYEDSVNCWVKVAAKSDPDYQAVVGVDSSTENFNTQVTADWDYKRPQVFKVYDGKGASIDDIKTSINNLMAGNNDSLQVVTNDLEYHLRTGDWVRVIHKTLGTFVLQIQKFKILNDVMTLTCGKKTFEASQVFGELLRKAVDKERTPLKVTAITTGSGSFVVDKEDATDAWRCYYRESFSPPSDGSDTPLAGFEVVKVNGKVIPPGRIIISDGSEVEIDITDYCTKSSTSAKTNIFVRTLYLASGWTTDGSIITQYNAKVLLAP